LHGKLVFICHVVADHVDSRSCGGRIQASFHSLMTIERARKPLFPARHGSRLAPVEPVRSDRRERSPRH
jgi:hypothetical protein